MADSGWVRVTRQGPCPVCQKPDWCLISQDGTAAICARFESDKPAGTKGAGWIHRLDSATLPPPRIRRLGTMRQNARAPRSVLNTAYRALLAELVLSHPHHDNLRHRGLEDQEIAILGYKTLPTNGRHDLTVRLQSDGVRLAGVPGFHLQAGHWGLAGPAGIAIPVRDLQHRIIGLQIRCDSGEGGRYKWLSSRGFNAGCSPGAPPHIAGPVAPGGEVWITEGPLKADIAALKLRCLVLAVAGVGNWAPVIPILQELGPQRVIIAFDTDKHDNRAVKLHSEALTSCLLRHGIRTFEADWDCAFKGLDDLLTGAEL